MGKAIKFIGIDLGASGITLGACVVDASGEVTLQKQAFARLEEDASGGMSYEALVALTLKRMLDAGGWPRWPARIAVAGHEVFSRLVTLPPVSAEKRERTIEHEAVQNFPFSMEELVWDYHLMEGLQGEAEVLLVASKLDVVEGLSHAVLAAGLQIEQVTASPVVLCNAVRSCLGDPQVSTLVLDVGARATNLIFIDGPRSFFRSIPVGGDAVTAQIAQELTLSVEAAEALKRQYADVDATDGASEPEQAVVVRALLASLTRLAQEVLRSITFYKNQQGGGAPERILLAGGVAGVRGMERWLADRLKGPVDFVDALPGMCLSGEQGGAAKLAGLALRHPAVSIAMMPPALEKAAQWKKRHPMMAACLVMTLFLMVLASWGLNRMQAAVDSDAALVQERVVALEHVVHELEPLEHRLDELQGQFRVYEGLVEHRDFWARVFGEVRSVLPVGMFVQRTEPLRGEGANAGARGELPEIRGLRISVISYLDREEKGVDAVVQLRNRLRALDLFSEQTEVFRRPIKRLFAREFMLDLYFEEPVEL